MPAATDLQIALWYGSAVEQALSVPLPPRLMLATSIVRGPFGESLNPVTQSMPQMIPERVPLPWLFSTRTAQRRAPGATPTTPTPLSLAAIVPATCVPWPLPSAQEVPVEQFLPPTTLRSVCFGSMPVSMTA